jgi:hypothetical protein
MRREIMALRQDPAANAVMAGAFTKSNAAYLKERLGRDATEGELYIAHFMGAGGAARLIEQSEAMPGAKAADAFPNAARANRSIFFDGNGRARNFAEVAQKLSGRYQVARARTATGDNAVAAAPGTGYAAETARVARTYESSAPLKVRVAAGPQQEPVFHLPQSLSGGGAARAGVQRRQRALDSKAGADGSASHLVDQRRADGAERAGADRQRGRAREPRVHPRQRLSVCSAPAPLRISQQSQRFMVNAFLRA